MPPDQICVWPFASGLNNAGEVIGFTRAGIPPGITIWSLAKGAWRRRCAAWPEEYDWVDRSAAHCAWAAAQVLKMGTVPVFADSGAYSVIKEWKKGEEAPKLSRDQWDVVMANYMALALGQRSRGTLWPVLPDEIGSQAGTMKQLRRYRPEIDDLLRARVTPIAVVHHGRRSLPDYASDIADALGTEKLVLAFPVAKGRTTPNQVRRAIEGLEFEPLGIHLLGISPQSARWHLYLRALADVPRRWTISTDAAMHRALFMRARHLGPLTKEQDDVAGIIEETVRRQRKFRDPLLRPNLSIRHELAEPTWWLGKAEREAIIADAISDGIVADAPKGLPVDVVDERPAEWDDLQWRMAHWDQFKLGLFRFDPSAALPFWVGRNWELEPAASWMATRLQEVYLRTLKLHTTALRKEQAIRRHYTGQRPRRLLRPGESIAVEPACFPVPRLAQMELRLEGPR